MSTVLLSAGELSAYSDFAASVFGLVMPLVMVSLLSITVLHYWKRKKRKKKFAFDGNTGAIVNDKSVLLPPGTDSEKIFALKKIKKQLLVMKARQVVIRHDYRSYQQQRPGDKTLKDSKFILMENFEDKIAGYEKQIEEMQRKIDMLETMPASTGTEAHYLRELLAEKENDIRGLQAVIDEKQSNASAVVPADNPLVEEQQREIERLRKKVSEQEHLEELLDETRQQLNFLQNQLEQRIKANKTLEQRINTLTEELSQQTFQFHEAGKKIIHIEHQLEQKEEATGHLRLELDKKENELRELREELNQKNSLLTASENTLIERMQEYEHQKRDIAGLMEKENSLIRQLNEERNVNEQLQQELLSNRQLLARFYLELKSSLREEANELLPAAV